MLATRRRRDWFAGGETADLSMFVVSSKSIAMMVVKMRGITFSFSLTHPLLLAKNAYMSCLPKLRASNGIVLTSCSFTIGG
jgi:hypothetical protein